MTCPSCHRRFTSMRTYDQHRTGKHPDRRCRTDVELRAIGVTCDARGIWRREVVREGVTFGLPGVERVNPMLGRREKGKRRGGAVRG